MMTYILTRIWVKAGLICLMALSLLTAADRAGNASERIFVVGVVNNVAILSPVLNGFKKGMAELGYVEDENFKYIYHGPVANSHKAIDAEIRNLLSQDVDMLLAVGNDSALRAKKAVEGTDIPVLAAACSRPVEAGLIKDMRRPEGNMTGVTSAGTISKALEWMKLIIPGLKKVYVPYNPEDEVSIVSLSGLDNVASKLGINLAYHKIHSVEEAIEGIKKLSGEGNAVYIIPSPTLNPGGSELSRAAINKGIPLGASVPLDNDVLITLSSDLDVMGKQTARLAHEINQGVKPVNIPMETSEVFLTINLKTAAKIGLQIPDDVLIQARAIIR